MLAGPERRRSANDDRLRVGLVGFQGTVVETMRAALAQCADAFGRKNGGGLRLHVDGRLAPPWQWYQCPKPPFPPPYCGPLQTVNQFAPIGQTPQFQGAGDQPLVVCGRSALGFKYGLPSWYPVHPNPAGGPEYDLILAYDIWQYWLAPLSMPLSAALSAHNVSLPQEYDSVRGHGVFYAAGRGSVLTGVPLLRSPMGIVARGTASDLDRLTEATARGTWTWGDLTAFVSEDAAGWGTGGFMTQLGYPYATEASAAAVIAAGGTLGARDGPALLPSYDSPSAVAGLTNIVTLLDGGRWALGGARQLTPWYLVDPLTLHAGQAAVLPFPRGALYGEYARYAPASYLCAFVPDRSPSAKRSLSFAAYLTESEAQDALAATGVGLPWKTAPAETVLRRLHANVRAPLAIASPAVDLRVTDLYSLAETDPSRTAFEGVADGFVRALSAVESPIASPDQVGAIIDTTLTA